MMRRVFALTGVCMVLTGALVATVPAQAQSSVKAVGSWQMVPQSKDTDGDGFIDGDGGVPKKGPLSRVPSSRVVGAGNHIAQPSERLINGSLSWYFGDKGFPVRLDACSSRGKQYRWTVSRDGAVTARTTWHRLSPTTCTHELPLPEGRYQLTLDIRDGSTQAHASLRADVVNYLTIVMGDSYASGEGNPRNVEAWLEGVGPFTAYWDDDACHRSVRGGPAQAALRLEESSPHSSVTLVDLSCSGATIDSGILGPQTGAGQQSSQIEQARQVVGERPVDLVLLTVGGNDVGFTSILASCALRANCPISKAVNAPLNRYPTVQDGVQTLTGKLTNAYARIAQCLGGQNCQLANKSPFAGLVMSPSSAVLPVMYPDITRSTDGQPCTYLTLGASDFGWARDTVLVPNPAPAYDYVTDAGTHVNLPLPQGTLNGQVFATGPMLGWHPVQRAWAASGDSAAGHGVCAQDPWVFGLTALSAMPEASFHPNPTGHLALGKAIAGALELAVR